MSGNGAGMSSGLCATFAPVLRQYGTENGRKDRQEVRPLLGCGGGFRVLPPLLSPLEAANGAAFRGFSVKCATGAPWWKLRKYRAEW